MTAKFVVGDTRAVTATLADDSVDFIMCSPPFLALRSYLPADHPDKALEVGSEATPAAFIDVMLELSAEWRRVLAPHGSIVVELGDTYSGSGGAGGDYGEDGLRAGQAKFRQMANREHRTEQTGHGTVETSNDFAPQLVPVNAGPGWPRAKSLTLIPEAYRFALAYGINPHTGQPSPAGRWQVRNVIRWVRPNPPVGALGKKWRPATSDLVVACPDDDKRYWDDVATRTVNDRTFEEQKVTAKHAAENGRLKHPTSHRDAGEVMPMNPAGAPLLDWWKIVPKGYEGAHYAVYPPELCTAPIDAMCPRRVCRTCGRPSERVTSEAEYVNNAGLPARMDMDRSKFTKPDELARHFETAGDNSAHKLQTTTGWTTCGHPGTDGLRLDGFHDGDGWRPGVVYDPFAGTGTTLAVATGMGRDAIGADLDSRNADLALERVGPLLLTVETLGKVAVVPDGSHNPLGSHPRMRTGYVNPWHKNPKPRVRDQGDVA